jgi:outer membrane protein
MTIRIFFAVGLFALANTGISQSVLTLDEVFKKALANNFDIQILESQMEIAENSATLGNAGLLPSVTASASAGININNTQLEFAGNIPPTSVDNAQSTNTNAGLTASYVLFKGLNGIRIYDKLKLNKELVDMQSQSAMEATLLQVANAYYVLGRAIDQERIATENVSVSKKRYDRALIAKELGTGLRTELLAARVDITSDSSALLNAQLQRSNAVRQLSRLINEEVTKDVVTEEMSIEIKPWTLDELASEAKANNSTLKNKALQQALAQKDHQMAWSSAFPQLSINGGYSYANSQSEAGIVLSNTAAGWNGSVALSYPLFNGFKNNINRQNQKVTMEIRALEQQSAELQLLTDLGNAYESYKQSVTVARFEESNLESAQLNLQRTEELYKGGQISSTQFREAQVAYVSSQIRISNAKISIKLNELELVRLTGQILSQQ